MAVGELRYLGPGKFSSNRPQRHDAPHDVTDGEHCDSKAIIEICTIVVRLTNPTLPASLVGTALRCHVGPGYPILLSIAEVGAPIEATMLHPA
jgi:hypothetical protein